MNCVALVDWNWTGHHPTFFNHFVMALEDSGAEVVALCPDPDGAAKHAARTRAAENADGPRRGSTRFAKISVPEARFGGLRPRRIGEIDRAIRHFTGIETQVTEFAAASCLQVDAVFHACIYERDFEWFHLARPFLRIPWTGLYLHAMSYRMPGRFRPGTEKLPRPDRIFHGKKCLGVAILDEGIVGPMADHLGKPVVAFPDPPDMGELADVNDRALGDDLKNFAAGRPVVGLFGHLLKSKGLLAFLEAAALPEAAETCFALGGEMLWPFDGKERAGLRATIDGLPNLWTHFERIPTEAALSHLMGSCDVIAAAYLDFPHSSGIQAKAAALGKPLIVSDGYLMAERVRRFGTGEVIPQGDARELLDAVLRIGADPESWIRQNQPRWRDYLDEHSVSRLKQALVRLLPGLNRA